MQEWIRSRSTLAEFFTEDQSLICWPEANREWRERWPESDTYIFIRKTAPPPTRVTFPPVCVMNSSSIRPEEGVLWIDIIQPSPGVKSGVLHMICKECWKKVSQDNCELWGERLPYQRYSEYINLQIPSLWSMSLLSFKSTYQENKHILTWAACYHFSFGLWKVPHNKSLGFTWVTADSCTGCALPKDTGALGKLKSTLCPTLLFIHPDLGCGFLPPCRKRHIFLIHARSSCEWAGVLCL